MARIARDKDVFWMNAKRPGECWECFEPIETGTRMVWDAREFHAYCPGCGEDVAGADPNPA